MATTSRSRNPLCKLLSSGIAVALGATSVAQANTHIACTTDDAGAGSLRQAIIDANADGSPPVTVDASLVSGTITLSTGELAITKGMSIQGPGAGVATIDGNNASRIFNVYAPSADVTISGFRLTRGKATSGFGGGAIFSRKTGFTLQDSVVDSSTFESVDSPGYGGGGVRAGGSGVALLISNVTLTGNSARSGGGVYLYTGPGAVAMIQDSVISGNTAKFGGGVYLDTELTGVATIKDSLVSGNTAYGGGGVLAQGEGSTYVQTTKLLGNHAQHYEGGGISGYFKNGVTSFNIFGCTVIGNTAYLSGGGISVYKLGGPMYMNHTLISGNTAAKFTGGGLRLYSTSAATATILNSTFSGNSAAGVGGGLAVEGSISMSLSNATVVGNSAGGTAGGVLSGVGGAFFTTIESSTIANNSTADKGGGVSAAGNPATLHNTVIANNSATLANPDINGTFTANFNFIRDPGNANLTGANNNTSGDDPLLGSLGDYGGSTLTKLPRPGSPLIDAGDPAVADGGTDQRGLDRVVGAHIDIGADEVQVAEDTIFLDGLQGY